MRGELDGTGCNRIRHSGGYFHQHWFSNEWYFDWLLDWLQSLPYSRARWKLWTGTTTALSIDQSGSGCRRCNDEFSFGRSQTGFFSCHFNRRPWDPFFLCRVLKSAASFALIILQALQDRWKNRSLQALHRRRRWKGRVGILDIFKMGDQMGLHQTDELGPGPAVVKNRSAVFILGIIEVLLGCGIIALETGGKKRTSARSLTADFQWLSFWPFFCPP